MEKRNILLANKPYIAKSVDVLGNPYKETYTLVMDEATRTSGVMIKRLTQSQYSSPNDLSGEESLVRVFRGKYYVLTVHGLRLDNFLWASLHIREQMKGIVDTITKEDPVEGVKLPVEDRNILINQIRTPDGTILVSRYRHDYVTYNDKNGFQYSVDGGTAYLRRDVHDEAPYEEISIYEGDDIDFEYFRTVFCRGGRGKDGTEPLKWVPLAEMSDKWVESVVTYEEELRPDNPYLKFFRQEIVYRDDNNIKIEE